MSTEATKITYVEGAAPSTPAASRTVVYAKADGLMYSKDDAGTETLMSGIPANPNPTTIELGHASDTTLARVSAGVISVEGNRIFAVGGADVPVADGGTGASTATAAFNALSPVTTRGDVIVRGATNNDRLALGTAKKALTSDGTDVVWAYPGLVLLEQQTASASANLNFTTAITSAFDEYQIELVNIIPATDNTALLMQCSTDGGSTYDITGIYDYTSGYAYSGGTGVGSSATGQGNYLLMDGVDNGSTYGVVGSIRLFNPSSTALYKQILGQTMRFDAGGSLGLVMLNCMGVYRSTTAVNALRFLMSSGNITSGTIRVYGVAK